MRKAYVQLCLCTLCVAKVPPGGETVGHHHYILFNQLYVRTYKPHANLLPEYSSCSAREARQPNPVASSLVNLSINQPICVSIYLRTYVRIYLSIYLSIYYIACMYI